MKLSYVSMTMRVLACPTSDATSLGFLPQITKLPTWTSKKQQRERTEAVVAKPSKTRRDARLLRAGTQRWSATGSSAETRP